MKVFSSPIPAPDYQYSQPYDRDRDAATEKAYREANKQWALKNGYTGPLTGKSICFGVADGHAEYMFIDGGRKSALLHLEISDAYQYPDVQFLPKTEIIRRMAQQKKMAALFGQNIE